MSETTQNISTNEGRIRSLDAQAASFFAAGRYEDALLCLLELGQLGARGEGFESNLLQCLFVTRRISDALPLAELLHRKFPERDVYAFYYSLCLSAFGRYRESYEVLRSFPNTIIGMASQKARFLIRDGKVPEAMELILEDEKFVPLEKFHEPLRLNSNKRFRAGMPLGGKRVLVLTQGGLGDAVATVRFSKLFTDRGAKVLLGVPKLLHPLFSSVPWEVDCREPHDVRDEEYDYYISNGSADLMLQLETMDPFTGIPFPYIFANPEERVELRNLINLHAGGRKKIGIHWQGQREVPGVAQSRDVPYELLEQFSKLGVLFSFQRDQGRALLKPGADIFDLGSRFESLADTAAAVSEMDYMVIGDAFIAHLAGAMNKKTALLLHLDQYLLWIRGGPHSLWYPSVRMFQQKEYATWDAPGKEAFEWILRDQIGMTI